MHPAGRGYSGALVLPYIFRVRPTIGWCFHVVSLLLPSFVANPGVSALHANENLWNELRLVVGSSRPVRSA